MRENICNRIDKGLVSKTYKQLMQIHIKKTQATQIKNEGKIQQTFLQRTCTGDQKAHEKMLNVTNYQRNANKNYNEISLHTDLWASLVAQLVKNCLQCGKPGFDPWVGKIPWRRERLPTPVFWPGEFHGLYSPRGHKESDTTE